MEPITKKQIHTLWDEKIRAILKQEEDKEEQFLNVLSLILFDKYNPLIGRLYKTLGLDTFTEIINIFSGYTLDIPKRQEFRDSILLALAYYYKEVKKMDWKEIKGQMDFEDFESLKIGRQLNKLETKIKENLIEIIEISEEEKKRHKEEN